MKVKVVGTKINDLMDDDNEDIYLSLYQIVSEERRKKLIKYIHKTDRISSIIGEILIRKYISEQSNICNSMIKFTYNKFGKPALLSPFIKPFNISHSGMWVLCALSDADIGIDIERIQPINFEEISKRFFTENEINQIFSLPASEQLDMFYSIWTAKESYVKALGAGLAVPLDSFEVNRTNKIVLNNGDSSLFYTIHSLSIDPDYKATVCLCSNISQVDFKMYSISDLIN